MKKIIIILFLVILPILVKAEETVDVKIEYIKDVYWNYKRNNILYYGNLAYFYVNDKIAYCMDLDIPIKSTTYTKSDKVLSSDIIYRFVYFGYGYDENNTLEDYMATQKILWNYTDSVKVYFTTKPNGLGDIIDISKNEERIRKDSNDYSKFPYYENLKFVIGTNNNINSENLINDKLIVRNETRNDVSIDLNNTLYINANEIGKSKFYLEKNYEYKHENIFYISDNSPEILVVGNINNIKKAYSYEVVGGSININVSFDKEIDKSITDNEFRLYNSQNELIGIYSPNEDGNININNLYSDTYILKHEKITEGYNTEKKEYIIEINKDNLNIQKNINLNIKQTKLIITQTSSNAFTNNLEYGSNVLYKIYDENDKCIEELVTDEKGSIEVILEYGNYKVIEINSNNANNENIIIDKSMFDDIIEYKINNKIYSSSLKIITLNENTREIIPYSLFTINGKEYRTNEDGICVLYNMNFGVYYFKNVNSRDINSLAYELSENSDVYIVNNEPYVDIYLYVNEDSKFNDKINEEIMMDNNKETNSNNNLNLPENNNSIEINKVEKLPFLGGNINTNENNKILIYIYSIIKFYSM